MPAQHSPSNVPVLSEKALRWLKQLIAVPSFSREESESASLLESFLKHEKIPYVRKLNNIWTLNKYADPDKKTILLNSHHDTVKPNSGYTFDPFTPVEKDGKLCGLGSNDAGASLVSLLAVFLHYYHARDLTYNIIFSATAEEEVSGADGIESILDMFWPIDFAIVGEPTQMHLSVAEKGLLVLDCISKGVSGHAAREEGDNAIYNAIKDIEWFKNYEFEKTSESLGKIKMSTTMIQSGTQHNVVPDECRFTVDIRCTDAYIHEELLAIIKKHVNCEVQPRSLRLKPSSISLDHPVVKAGVAIGRTLYGSPTTSDQALMPFTSVKMGPGDSARSHGADEFIYTQEIEEAIHIYIQLLDQLILT
jgi:acetylornithine deacetylase